MGNQLQKIWAKKMAGEEPIKIRSEKKSKAKHKKNKLK